MKEVYFSNAEYSDILNQLNQLMQEADQISVADHKVLLYQILQLFDSIHREPLARIQNALVSHPKLKEEIEADPAVEKLMSLYDLIKIKDQNIKTDEKQVAFIPEDQVMMMTIPKKKEWLELGDVSDFEPNKIYPKNYQKVNFIITKIGTDIYAGQNQCDGSFLPIDFDGANNKVFHHEITEILESSPAKFKLCIADACHSGSLFAEKGASGFAFESFYKSLAQSKPGMALIMSSKSEETSLESNNLRQGVFSHFLIRGLKGEADSNGNNIVTVEELFNYLNTTVTTYTGYQQTPVIKGDYDRQMTVAVRR